MADILAFPRRSSDGPPEGSALENPVSSFLAAFYANEWSWIEELFDRHDNDPVSYRILVLGLARTAFAYAEAIARAADLEELPYPELLHKLRGQP